MRLIKMFGLAAVAAVAAMAFVGASSAVAGSTLLCTTNTAELAPASCTQPAEVHFLSVVLNAEKKYVDGHAELLTNLGITVKCNVLIQGTVKAGLVTNGPVVTTVAIAGLVYSGCLEGCEVTTLKGGTISVLKTGVELAEVTGTGFEVKVKCGSIINCVYGAEGLIGHGLGPTTAPPNGHVTFTESTVKKVSGFLCPSTSKLDALFASLSPIYIRA